MKIRSSLSLMIILLVILTSLTFTSIALYLNLQEQNKFFQETTLDKAISLANALDASIGSKEELKNQEKLQNHIYKHIWLNPDIIRININLPTSEGLKVAVSNEINLVGTLSGPENQQSYEKDKIISELIQIKDVSALKVITPIHVAGQSVGTYEIFLSLESANKAIKRQNRNLFLIGVGTLLFLIFFLLISLRKVIISPLRELSKGMEEVETGNLKYKVKIKSSNELGDLGEAFNKMTEDLEKYKKKSEMREKELEQMVKKRTSELEEMKEKYRNLAQSLSKVWLKKKK